MKRKLWLLPAALWAAFLLFTLLLTCVDEQPIGPQGSAVGFATVNGEVFQLLGVHFLWYHITDWLGVVAIVVAFGFAVAGLYQWVKRKSLRKVDRHILVLGGFYLLVIACYLFFEKVVINCRPILMDGNLEASYPSSHTMIVVSIMATASMAFRALCPQKKGWCLAVDIFAAVVIAVTVMGRLIAGVHWLTDIVGGLLLSAALVATYWAVCWGGKDKKRAAEKSLPLSGPSGETRLHFCQRAKIEEATSVRTGGSNSPPDCCDLIFESPAPANKKIR